MKPYGKMGRSARWGCPCCDLFRTGRTGLHGSMRKRRLRILKKGERRAVRELLIEYLKGG